MTTQVSDPIHLPCPDMAGCTNFDPSLSKRNAPKLAELLKMVRSGMPRKTVSQIPESYRQASIRDIPADEK
ncbi:hypothetical protein [Vibrio sp. SCSIO 43137]|uniref:hypothetical protein n=1 Tax=Vibrio sp. SCSIO 43137 TaxID=3021011 RepID=UPI002307BDC8|nr:hypothetical protein [Vibrio sp. SCSIO 43137]WCE31099.1 hypothetical protein PK654_07495 [Vibrio sp. SCSIO 43137]